jgi:hypothetical protein
MKAWTIRILRSICLLMAIGAAFNALNYFSTPNRSDSTVMAVMALLLCGLFTTLFRWSKKFDPNCPKWAFWVSLVGTWIAISIAVVWPQRSRAIKSEQESKELSAFNAARSAELTERTEAKLSKGQNVDYITSAEALRINQERRAVGSQGSDPQEAKNLTVVRSHYDRALELKKLAEDAGLKFYEQGGISPNGLKDSAKAQSRLASLTEFERTASNQNEYWLSYIPTLERAMLNAGANPALAKEVSTRSAEHYMSEDQLAVAYSNSESAKAARNLINFLILTSSRWSHNSTQDTIEFEIDAEIETYNELLGKFEASQSRTQALINQLVAKRNARLKNSKE